MSKLELESEIEHAFATGNNAQGLKLLRTLSRTESNNAAVWHRLAVVEEQIGDVADATQAHLRCLQLGRNNPLAYLYAGYWLERNEQLQEALPIYSLGLDLIERTVSEEDLAQQSPQTLERYHAAVKARNLHLLDLHHQAVGNDSSCRRIYDSVWVKTSPTNTSRASHPQHPHLFYIPELPNTIGAENPCWLSTLEQNNQVLVDEFNQALPLLDAAGRPYLDANTSADAGFGALPGSLNWTALDLFKDGARQDAIADLFPKTLSLLEGVPLYGLNEEPFEVFFSVLKAGQKINPHYGLSNHSLTVHLPIDVPQNCQLIVDGKAYTWQRGKAIVFDDTLRHAAENNGDRQRVVLIFSIWNPNLSLEERAAIQRSFNSRASWLEQRRIVEPIDLN